jgi:hypothetical protein
MRSKNHVKACIFFWKPSVARKITLYFTIFGLLVFYLTSVAYLIAAKKGIQYNDSGLAGMAAHQTDGNRAGKRS